MVEEPAVQVAHLRQHLSAGKRNGSATELESARDHILYLKVIMKRMRTYFKVLLVPG